MVIPAFRIIAMPDSIVTAVLPPDLHYVDDSQPGLSRKILRGKFVYFDLDGQRIRDEAQIKRINSLVIPPAYTDVWICADPRGHLQATGRDARGRKQYRYHPRWREVRDTDKYSRLQQFGNALPKLRAQLEAQIAAPGFTREKVLATVVMLLDATLIRVGNTQYARDNKSYGLTTLRTRHVDIKGSEILFQFRGKSGVEHQVSVKDRRLATAVLRELEWQPESDAKRHVVAMVKDVAKQLGNTPAVCRKCYIHPAVLEHFSLGELSKLPKPRVRKGLKAEEVALAMFLEQLAADLPKNAKVG